MIIVTGSVLTNADNRAAIEAEGVAHCGRSRAEPGCIAHNCHYDVENPDLLVFVEKWMDGWGGVAGAFCGASVRRVCPGDSRAIDRAAVDADLPRQRDCRRRPCLGLKRIIGQRVERGAQCLAPAFRYAFEIGVVRCNPSFVERREFAGLVKH